MRFDTNLGCSIGVAVRDLEPALDLYTQGLGLGPFQIEELDLPGATDKEGRPAPARMRVATAPLGNGAQQAEQVCSAVAPCFPPGSGGPLMHVLAGRRARHVWPPL